MNKNISQEMFMKIKETSQNTTRFFIPWNAGYESMNFTHFCISLSKVI